MMKADKKTCNYADFYNGQRKRLCVSKADERERSHFEKGRLQTFENINDVSSALILLKSYFPVEKFENRLPPIVIQHQLYSIMPDKTTVDKQLNEMKKRGAIRCFHLGAQTDNVCILFKEDFIEHVEKISNGNETATKFLNYIITKNYTELSITREKFLKNRTFKEEDITDLMRLGLLTVRDVGSFWFSIPRAGEFMKFYLKGRKAILTMIRKCKYCEILEKELTDRKLPKIAKLGMDYYIHDIIGAELISFVPTTSGRLFRLVDYD